MHRLLLLMSILCVCLFNAACTPGTYYPFGGSPGKNPYYDPPKGQSNLYHTPNN